MVNVDEAIIARLKTNNQTFEILVDCNMALALKEGKNVDMKDILAAVKIFSDAKKGLEASENAMKQIFETSDPEDIAKTIIQKGEIHLTSEYKTNLREQKRKQIINVIHVNGVDPKTHLPHPPQRIENAFEEAKIHVDEFKSVQEQVQEVLKKIRPILPIKFEVKEISVKIPADFAAKSYQILNSFGTKLKEDWQSDGSLLTVLEMPGGLENDFYDKLNSLTHGSVETKVLNTK
jgi:ribosome maturation protein SDO1|tara:strand:+ start:304 stop:1005 length:702 start_codon:yes stop_codon:yes gene_type:complete